VASQYPNNPVGFAHNVLGIRWWYKQKEIANALIKHKRVFVKASHGVGKTHVMAGLVLWFYHSFRPCVILTTAPTAAQVEEVLWKEIRVQAKAANLTGGLYPSAPKMKDADDHFAVGYTARDAESFQGRHSCHVFIAFDECVGIAPEFWQAAYGMALNENCYWLSICNPTDPSSFIYKEELQGKFHTITVSALDHPNITQAKKGKEAPFPGAVTLNWVEECIERWCDPVPVEDRLLGDFEWNGLIYRPGPLFESRVLGRWPTLGTDTVWTEDAWKKANEPQPIPEDGVIEIGCDVARYGDDYTTIIARQGSCAIHYETHNGWSTSLVANRLKEIARMVSSTPEKVEVKIDDDGVGGGVIDQKGDYKFLGVSAGSRAINPSGYPNKRSEAWFYVAEKAMHGAVDLSRLPAEAKEAIRQQIMAPKYTVDSQGRRVVEPKDRTKSRLGRSPDDVDALNLCYYRGTRVWEWA